MISFKTSSKICLIKTLILQTRIKTPCTLHLSQCIYKSRQNQSISKSHRSQYITKSRSSPCITKSRQCITKSHQGLLATKSRQNYPDISHPLALRMMFMFLWLNHLQILGLKQEKHITTRSPKNSLILLKTLSSLTQHMSSKCNKINIHPSKKRQKLMVKVDFTNYQIQKLMVKFQIFHMTKVKSLKK